MEVNIKKLFNGHVSVRDYMVRQCVAKGENLTIIHENQKMTVPLSVIKNPQQLFKTEIQSKYSNATYQLYDFKWKPERDEQGKLIQ